MSAKKESIPPTIAPSSLKVSDDEMMLIIRRDIPNMKEEIDDMSENMNDVVEKIIEQKEHYTNLSTKFDLLSEHIKEFKTDTSAQFKKLDDRLGAILTKEEVPWYKSFEKVLIMLLILGLGSVAGVTSYGDILKAFGGAAKQTIVPSSIMKEQLMDIPSATPVNINVNANPLEAEEP